MTPPDPTSIVADLGEAADIELPDCAVMEVKKPDPQTLPMSFHREA